MALRNIEDTEKADPSKLDRMPPKEKDRGKLITFWVTEQQKQELTECAKAHHVTLSRLIKDSLSSYTDIDL